MPRRAGKSLASIRAHYAARLMDQVRRHGFDDARVEAAFAAVPREHYLMAPPWYVGGAGRLGRPTSDPADLYHDELVALDPDHGINNGQPSLHAGWMVALGPRPGEHVVQVGVGAGYYTAILALLVAPDGRVDAYEIAADLAARARVNLAGVANVCVHLESGFGTRLPACDIIYVSAGVAAPDPLWLEALRPGGRLVFPWQAGPSGLAMQVTRRAAGFSALSLMRVSFVNCVGAGVSDVGPQVFMPSHHVQETHSVWLTRDRAPDDTATAIYEQVWFSASEPGSR